MDNLESPQARWAKECNSDGDCPFCNPTPQPPKQMTNWAIVVELADGTEEVIVPKCLPEYMEAAIQEWLIEDEGYSI